MAMSVEYEDNPPYSFDNRLSEMFSVKDMLPSQFQSIFPWMSEGGIQRFRDDLEAMYPDGRTPLSSFMERVSECQNPKKEGATDLPIDAFCSIFSITPDEAIEFSRRRQERGIQTPFASMIQHLRVLPPTYRDQFARMHVNVGNFNNQETTVVK